MIKSKTKKEVRVKKETVVRKLWQEKPKSKTFSEDVKQERITYLLGDMEFVPKTKVPELSVEDPHIAHVADPANPKFMVINSPLIGALEEADHRRNPLKNALRIAASEKADAVFIAGNLIHFITQHYGSTYPYKSQVSSLPTDSEIVSRDYPKAVLRDSGSIASRVASNKIVFMPVKTRLDIVLKMVKGQFREEGGEPIYRGPILITFGSVEEALAMQYTTERLRIDVLQERSYAREQIRSLQTKLRQERKNEELNGAAIASTENDMKDFQAYERIFALMGNASPEYINLMSDAMMSYIIWRYERDIPNAKVISVGDAHIKAGHRLIQITYQKSGESLSDNYAGHIREDTYSRIKNNAGELIPDVILGAGFNPTFRNLLVSHRVRSRKAMLEDVKLCHCIQLTTCIDDARYRKIARKRVRVKDDLMKLAARDNFTAGVFWLEWWGDFYLPRFYSGECLTKAENFVSADAISALSENRIYAYKEGCSHHGGKAIAIYPSQDDPDGRYRKFHYQVAFEMLLKMRAPIASYQHDGDACHGINYQTWLENSKEQLDVEPFLRQLMRLNKMNRPLEEKLKSMTTLAMENAIRLGIIDYERQVDSYVLSLEPYLEFWARILEYCRDNGIEFRGEFAAITQGRGNHSERSFSKDTKVDISEAKMIRQIMVSNLLEKYPHLKEEIKKNFIAPHVGRLGYANGAFAFVADAKKRQMTKDQFLLQNDFYVYAAQMKHKMGSSKTTDNMAKGVKAFAKQGTSNMYEAGRMCVILTGDDHFGAVAITRTGFHEKTGCQTFENEFGKRFDFPEQNIFSSIWSVPAHGPSAGPLSWIILDYGILRKYAHKPFPIDREKVFRGAVGLTGVKSEEKSQKEVSPKKATPDK